MLAGLGLVGILTIWKAEAFSVAPQSKVRGQTKLFHSIKNEAFDDRRSFLLSGLATAVTATSLGIPLPAVAASVDYKAVAADIMDLVKKNPDWGPTLVRLAWHSSGTYDKISKTGGSNDGTIRFKEELAHGGNAGLADTAIVWMEPIHKKYADAGLSYGDLYTLGGGT